MTFSFRKLTPLATGRDVAEIVNNCVDGKFNVTGDVTLTNSATSTVVTDIRVSAQSYINFQPTTADGASELAAGTMYVSSQGKQTFTISHANDTTTRSFRYVVLG